MSGHRSSDVEGVGGHPPVLVCVAFALALALLSVSAAGAGAAVEARRTLAAAEPLETEVLAELNEIRRAHGLSPLRAAPAALARPPRALPRDGTVRVLRATTRATAPTFWKRVQRFYGPERLRHLVGRREPPLVVGHADAAGRVSSSG